MFKRQTKHVKTFAEALMNVQIMGRSSHNSLAVTMLVEEMSFGAAVNDKNKNKKCYLHNMKLR